MLASRRRVTSLGRQDRSGGTGARSLGRRGAGELARFRVPLPFSPLNGWSPSASHTAKPLPRHSPRGVHSESSQTNYAESASSQVGWRRNRGDDGRTSRHLANAFCWPAATNAGRVRAANDRFVAEAHGGSGRRDLTMQVIEVSLWPVF